MKHKTIFNLWTVLCVTLASLTSLAAPVLADGWWDPAWLYRDPILIDEQPYRQAQVEIDALSLVDQGHVRQDLGDLRFVTVDNQELAYWIDPKTVPFTFQDDFSGDLSRWTLHTGGGFSIVAGELTSSGDQNILLADAPQLANYAIETDVKLTAGSLAGVVIGYQGNIIEYDGAHRTFYLVRIAADAVKIFQVIDNSYAEKWSSPVTVSPDVWYRLKVEHMGSAINIYLDGSPVGAWVQPWPTGWDWQTTSLIMNAEGVGLMNDSGAASWDDVAITTRPATCKATVRMPSRVTAPTTIYMYYGNPGAASQSDIQSTFFFGDDFDDGDFDESKWGVRSQDSSGVWTDEIRWVTEENGRQEIDAPIGGTVRVYVHSLDPFTGPATFKTRFEKGGYIYRGFQLLDSPVDEERTINAYVSFSDCCGYSVGVWTSAQGTVEDFTLDDSFASRNYFGEYTMTIIRNANGTFTFQVQTEDEQTRNWTYTTTATFPLDTPLYLNMYATYWSGARGWGIWEPYHDDVRILSAEGGTVLTATPDVSEVYPDDTVTVDLDVLGADNLYAAQATCAVNPAILEVQSGVFGDFFDAVNRLIGANAVDAVAGTWTGAISQRNPAGPLSGDGRFATVTYEALTPGTTAVACDVTLSNRDGFTQPVTFVGAEITVLPYATISGTATYQGRLTHAGITVTATGPVTRTDVTGSDGQFVLDALRAGSYDIEADADRYLPNCTMVAVNAGDEAPLAATMLLGGDVNDDDVINIGDATLIGNNFGQTVPPADARADVNADNLVNVQDLAILGGNYELAGCQGW
ncbi:MAG: DUF2341 domain-containing protein [Anaerolineae bacterium]|nr:DUF2341 domain-containing protein [Anaerolineae bacterium]